jgi:hypothetical protein
MIVLNGVNKFLVECLYIHFIRVRFKRQRILWRGGYIDYQEEDQGHCADPVKPSKFNSYLCPNFTYACLTMVYVNASQFVGHLAPQVTHCHLLGWHPLDTYSSPNFSGLRVSIMLSLVALLSGSKTFGWNTQKIFENNFKTLERLAFSKWEFLKWVFKMSFQNEMVLIRSRRNVVLKKIHWFSLGTINLCIHITLEWDWA